MTKYETKSLIIARYGMLQCGVNFKGTMSTVCQICNLTDDEHHRLNVCPKWNSTIIDDGYVDFDLIYSDSIDLIRSVMKKISNLWNTKCAHGTMRKE